MHRTRKSDVTKKTTKSKPQQNLGIFDMNFGIDDFKMDNNDVEDDDDEDLEAELNMILSSGPVSRPRPPPPRKPVALENLDAMIAASLKDDNPASDDDSGGEDDPDLIAELNEMTGESVDQPQAVIVPTSEEGQASVLSLLNQRLDIYNKAENVARVNGDLTKARRLKRGLDQLKCLIKKAESGNQVREDEIPLPVVIGAIKEQEPPVDGDQSTENRQIDPDIPMAKEGNVSIKAQSILDSPIVEMGSENIDGKSDALIPEPPPEQEVKSATTDFETLSLLSSRRDAYKKAAVRAKRSGDTATALAHVKIIKQFEAVISAVESGQKVDLSSMPPPPPSLNDTEDVALKLAAGASPPPIPPRSSAPASPSLQSAASPPPIPPRSDATLSPPPVQPKIDQIIVQQSSPDQGVEEVLTVMGALESRLAKFKEQEESAKKEGNSSKVRRMGRIVKQYQDAIRLHKAGKPIPVDDLPTPPGFPAIPVDGGQAPAKAPPPTSPDVVPSPTTPAAVSPPSAPVPSDPSPATLSPQQVSPVKPTEGRPSVSPKPSTSKGQQGHVTRQDRQMATLMLKQKQYKLAALKAKQSGDMDKAKEYLRLAKGFDSLIDATNSGLPVDMDTLPRPPGKSPTLDSFEVVKISDCLPKGTHDDIYKKINLDLQNQFKMCIETKNHYTAMGDVANANRFEHFAVNTKRDIDLVRAAQMNDPNSLPKFHYEKRSFSMVRCNTDLNDNDLELSIIRGVNYNVPNPKEIDTYVKFEFPLPNDEFRREKTSTIYNTNNPNYNVVYNIQIQRTSRSFLRIFKRHSLKLEIWSKGGFLRSDALLGTVQVKLQPLETKCTLHDAFDVMDGRKSTGGKIEIKLRVRNPLLTKQVEQVNERWIVIE